MSIKKLLLAALFLGVMQELKSEYIVFQKGKYTAEIIKDNSSLGFYKKIYQVLLKYQWPTCIAYFHKTDQKEIALYTSSGNSAEENYLRAKIIDIDKNLDIAFFPTFLYELFFIANYENYERDFNFRKLYCEAPYTAFSAYRIIKHQTDLKSLFQYLSTLNDDDVTKKIHLKINNDLLKYIKNFDFYRHSKSGKNIAILIEMNIDTIVLDLLNKTLIEWSKDDCKKIINLEYKAHKNNTGLIYRGNLNSMLVEKSKLLKQPIEFTYFLKQAQTNSLVSADLIRPTQNLSFNFLSITNYDKIDFNTLIDKEKITNLNIDEQARLNNLKNELLSYSWHTPSRSISYGNSIFAGYFEDMNACSYFYMKNKSAMGYALHINKWLYYQGLYSTDTGKKSNANPIDGELFTISPLNTIVALFGYGSLFHSRSKSYYFSKDTMVNFTPFIEGLGSCRDVMGYFVKNESPLQRGAELAQFIANRAELIKLPEYQGGFNFPTAISKNYFICQNEIASSFGTMTKLEPYLKQQLGMQ